MPAPFIVPFNNQPVNTGVTTASYTVPAGKYARVIVSIGLTALINKTNANETLLGAGTPVVGNYSAQSGHFNDKLELWLKAGDVLSFTTSVASGSFATSNIASSLTVFRTGSATTSATITLNASTLGTFYATAQGSIHAYMSAAQTIIALTVGTFTGNATVVTHFEEFNVIS